MYYFSDYLYKTGSYISLKGFKFVFFRNLIVCSSSIHEMCYFIWIFFWSRVVFSCPVLINRTSSIFGWIYFVLSYIIISYSKWHLKILFRFAWIWCTEGSWSEWIPNKNAQIQWRKDSVSCGIVLDGLAKTDISTRTWTVYPWKLRR